jgi:hypothetical protein
MRFIIGNLILGCALVGCVRQPDVTTDQLPLRRVVVYRNGVGYFERAGKVEAEEVTFKMRQRMVGDFLATLAIVERGGSSVRSASFPLEIEDEDIDPNGPDPRFQRLLRQWQPDPSGAPPDPYKMRKVVLQLDGKEHDLAIGYVSATPLWRPSYRLVVQANGQADPPQAEADGPPPDKGDSPPTDSGPLPPQTDWNE